jgi:very-short-patch-repair endonuclease
MNGAFDRLASRQHSLITTAQLLRLGRTKRQIFILVKNGDLIPIRHGVYRVAGSPVSWIQAIHAAVLAAGADAVISHMTAAALKSLRYADRDHCGLHLTAGHRVRLAGVTAHTIALSPGDTTVYLGVPVTTTERTLIDLAGTLALKELGRCLDDALRRGLINLERLRRSVAAAPTHAGRRRLAPLHDLLAERIPGYRPDASDWEKEMNRLWDRLGLEPGVPNYRVKANGHTYFIDRAIPDLMIGAEYDSHHFHDRPSDRHKDAQRTVELSAEGWHIIPLTAETRPEIMRAAVQRIVADRRRWLPRDRAPGAVDAVAT